MLHVGRSQHRQRCCSSTAAACGQCCVNDAPHVALLQYPGIDCGGAEWNCVMVNGFYWQCRNDDGGASQGAASDCHVCGSLAVVQCCASLATSHASRCSSASQQSTQGFCSLLYEKLLLFGDHSWRPFPETFNVYSSELHWLTGCSASLCAGRRLAAAPRRSLRQ
jgi:hypothetical protein